MSAPSTSRSVSALRDAAELFSSDAGPVVQDESEETTNAQELDNPQFGGEETEKEKESNGSVVVNEDDSSSASKSPRK